MARLTDDEIDVLRRAAHEAPLAKVYETHTGHKFIGVHTDAWWKASRAYAAAQSKGETNASKGGLSE